MNNTYIIMLIKLIHTALILSFIQTHIIFNTFHSIVGYPPNLHSYRTNLMMSSVHYKPPVSIRLLVGLVQHFYHQDIVRRKLCVR